MIATLAMWKHCDATVSQTTWGRWLLETQSTPKNVTNVRNCSLCEPWWYWWDFATRYQRLAFDILWIVITSIRWHFVYVTWHFNLNTRPQNAAPRADVSPSPLDTPLYSRQNHKFASSYAYSQIYWIRTKLQKLSYWYILQNKNRSCTCSEMLNPVPYFSKHSIQSCATLPVALANVSKPQLLYICRYCWVFNAPTWNLSIRSKTTRDTSFLMLLAYCKQIIQNQRKTVRRAVTINVCWRKSSCELFPLATTQAKVANSGSGKMVIAR